MVWAGGVGVSWWFRRATHALLASVIAAASVATVVGAPVAAPPGAAAAPVTPIHAQTVSLGGLPSACSASGAVVTCTFSYTGGDQSLTIPSPPTSISIDLKGGQGGNGGNGGELKGTWTLSGASSTPVTVKVGGAGSGTTSRTYPDGGAGGSGSSNNGCSGGGGSELWVGATLVAAAGGGGGCSGNGTVAGCSGFCSGGGVGGGSGGGASGTAGAGGGGSSCQGGGGGGGGQTSGGSGGSAGCSGGGGGTGSQGYGGDGGSSSVVTGIGGGGGGGGGWYGGGGGGSSGDGYGGGGGGGGGSSGATSAVSVSSNSAGVNSGSGSVTLSWGLTTPALSVAAPANVPVGSATTFSASVSDPSQPTYSPLGTVTFTDTTTGATLCSAVPVLSGSASCSVPQGPGGISVVGANTITAAYSGDGALAPASAYAAVNGTPDPTTVSVSSGAITGSGSPSIPLTATVTPASYASGNLTGSVQFTASSGGQTLTLCNSGALNAAAGTTATVSCTWASPAYTPATFGSTYSVTASYSGDATNASSSNSTTVAVNKAGTTTTNVAAPSSVTYGQAVTATATVSGIPSGDSTPGTVTYTAGGSPISCTGSGQTNPATVSGSGAVTSCTYVPTNASNVVTATYAGDAQTSSSSGSASIVVNPAPASLALAVQPQGGNADVTVPLSLVVTETNTLSTGAAPDLPVDFSTTAPSADITVPSSCTGVVPVATGPETSVATCALPSGPTSLTTVTFDAAAASCPVTTGGCSLWSVSGPSPVSVGYTPGPDPTALVLSPSDTQVHPVHVPAGTAITVTATVSDTAGTQQPVGKITFSENGGTITATSGSTCSGLTPIAGTSPGVASASCTFVPPAGSNVAVTATYDTGADATDPLTSASDTSTAPYYVVVGGGSTSTSVSLETTGGATLTAPVYGQPVLLVAAVTSPVGTVSEGTVDFTLSGSPVTASGSVICQNVAVSAGTAVCSASYQPPAGGDTFGATFADAGGAFLGSSGSSVVTVGAAQTSTTVNAVPDPTTAGTTDLVVSVSDAPGSGGTLPPAGTVTVSGGSASCTGLALVAVTGTGSASATCAVATPSTVTAFSVTFTPASTSQFQGSVASLSFPSATGACSGAFAALWTAAASGSLSLGAGGFGTASDGLSFAAAAPGTCDQASDIVLSKGTLSMFGGTLTGTGMSGYVAASPAGAQVCLDGGGLGLPAGWKFSGASLTLSATSGLCFTVSSVVLAGTSVSSITFSGVSGQVSAPLGTSLPFGNPDATVSYGLTLSFAGSPSGERLIVSLAPSSATGSRPFVAATVTVTSSGGTVTASGSVTLSNLLVGGPVHASFSAGTGATGAWAGSISVSGIGTSPISPVPGLGIEDVTVTLTAASGLTVTGTLLLGSSTSPATVAFSGGYASGTWSLSVASSTVAWSPFSTLSVSLAFTGSVTLTTSGTVRYDIEAGSPGATTALFTWTAGAGVVLSVSCVAFAYGVTPGCDAAAGAGAPVDPTLLLGASVTIGGTGGLSVGVDGSIDLHTGAVALALAAPVTVTIATGFTVTVDTLAVTGAVGQPIAVHGQATAQIAALGLSSSPTVSITASGGSLLVTAGGLDFSGIGVPLTGFFAYSTGPVTNVATGDPALGSVDVAAGFNAFGALQVPAGLASALAEAGFTVPGDGYVVFGASWAPGSTPTFTAQLAAPAGFPFLTLPGGGTLTSASLTYASSTLTLAAAGTIPVPGSPAAAVSMTLTVGMDGSIAGTATVTGLTVFGVTVDLAGSVDRTAGGSVSASVGTCTPTASGCTPGPIAGPLTPFPGVPVTLTDVTLDLGTSGLTVGGTMSVAGLTSLSLSGTLTSLQKWSLTAALAAASPWTPVPGVTIDAVVSGTITDNNGPVTFDLAASGHQGAPLFTLSLGVDLSVNSVSLGNAAPPSGCTVAAAGDLWLAVDGSLSASLGSVNGSATASGCFDLSAHSAAITATLTQLGFSASGGHVTVGAPAITISEGPSGLSVAGSVLLTVSMPSGGSFSQSVTLDFGAGGAFVIGGALDMSQWLGSAGSNAYVYYASQAQPDFSTGVAALGTIDLAQGLNFALTVSLPQSVVDSLGAVGIHLSSGAGMVALGQADFTTDVYTLRISMSLGADGVALFTAGQVSLVLDTGYLQLRVSAGQMTFGVGMTATLDMPSLYSGDPGSSVALDGQLSVGTQGVEISLSLGQCGSSGGTAWTDAFGIPGLTVQCAQLTGGVSVGPPPFPNVGFAGTITSLPSVISDVIGYQGGAPISFAFNLDPLLLSLSIGTKNSGTPALEPLAFFGQGNLIQIDYASLYVSPEGATIGQTVYPAGLGLGFQASIDGVPIDVLADIGISPPSINFTGTIGKISLGGLSIGPVSLTIAASTSPPSFEFAFSGQLNLGPGSVQIGPALQVGGGLSSNVEIDISTSGISAFIWGSIAVTVSVYVPTQVCYWKGFFPYPCDYQWEGTSGSFTLGRTGFSINSSGVTLEADGYSITFGFNGSVSITTAYQVPATVPVTEGQTAVLASLRVPATGSAILVGTVPLSTIPSQAGGRAEITTLPAPTGDEVIHPATPATPRASAGSGAAARQSGSWGRTGPLSSATADGATVALADGEVLQAGGVNSTGVLATSQVYNPRTGAWRVVGSLTDARMGAAAVRLASGKVLVAGGLGTDHAPLASAELYDPATRTWSSTGSLHTPRAFTAAVLLGNGDVLVAGGTGSGHRPLASAEVYDPARGTWSTVAPMSMPRAFAAAAPLPGGGALVAGGFGAGGELASAERFDPATGSWSPAGSMSQPRMMAAAVALPGGDVLVVGDGAIADRYHPATGTWTATDGMEVPRTAAAVVPLPGGSVLVAGGMDNGHSLSSSERYDPVSGIWSPAGSLTAPRAFTTGAGLPDGGALVDGGADVSAGSGRSFHLGALGSTDRYVLPSGPPVPPGPSAPPVASVGISAGVLILGSAGGVFAVFLAGALVVAVLRRRRGLPPA